jgi:putative chitinase
MNSSHLALLGIHENWYDALQNTFNKYQINTIKRQAHFIGQCAHESNWFNILEENLNYSAQGLMSIWGSRFPTIEIAQQYAKQPEKIANKVYGGRMGNLEDGDGWKYRGRGIIQLTGRENYRNTGRALGLDLEGFPELALVPLYACLSAGHYWSKKGLNELADKDDYKEITRRINGGQTGIMDRIYKTKKTEEVLGRQI